MNNGTAELYTDGASRGNPGEAGAGIALVDGNGNVLFESKRYLGRCTNNEAEYRALVLGLEETLKKKFRIVNVHLDSELVVRQMEGVYKIKNTNLGRLAAEAKKLLSQFGAYTIQHVPRHLNKEADRLANEAIDEYNKTRL
jgi:ribonuclease HI